jgi:prophage regulatory protein
MKTRTKSAFRIGATATARIHANDAAVAQGERFEKKVYLDPECDRSEVASPADQPSRPVVKVEGFLRLNEIIAPYGPIPVKKSAWWAGVRDGRFPQPVRLGRRITAWHIDDIRGLVQRLRTSHG